MEHHLKLELSCYFLSSYPDKSPLPQHAHTQLIHCHIIKIRWRHLNMLLNLCSETLTLLPLRLL